MGSRRTPACGTASDGDWPTPVAVTRFCEQPELLAVGRAEAVAEGVENHHELVAVEGSFPELRARGQLRLEGKDYLVRDGEICHFRFNVAK